MLLDQFQAPIRKKLEACDGRNEAWKQQHEIAKIVFRFEDQLGDLVECFREIDRLSGIFSSQVIEHPNSYDEEVDQAIHWLQGEFLRVAVEFHRLLPTMREQVGGDLLENEKDFEACVNRAVASSRSGFESEARMDQQPLLSDIRALCDFG